MNRRTVCVFGLAALIEACGKKKPQLQPPPVARPRTATPQPSVPAGTTERGVASWYGPPYHGRPAADGEIYDMNTLVAAHRTLPFQTRLLVRNLSNGKTVEVRVIDRGPFARGRIIDLSRAAAQQIELIGPGIAEVEITVLSAPALSAPAAFAVQVGAFQDKSNADRMEQRMAAAYGAAKQALRGGDPPLWRILAGRVPTIEDAERLAVRIRKEQNVPQAFVVRLD